MFLGCGIYSLGKMGMKERPILFSAPMVRALLEGIKTQTRRVVKLPVDAKHTKYWAPPSGRSQPGYADPGVNYWTDRGNHLDRCPYGQPGDRLWVRETWRIGAWDEDYGKFAIDYVDGPRKDWLLPFVTATEEPSEVFDRLWIDCCDELLSKYIQPENSGCYKWEPGESPLRWRPSIHMPRWVSRITLEITGIRVEQLQTICGDDAISEGIKIPGIDKAPLLRVSGKLPPSVIGKHPRDWTLDDYARFEYAELWEQIKGPGSWAANPWVWVIEFKRVHS